MIPATISVRTLCFEESNPKAFAKKVLIDRAVLYGYCGLEYPFYTKARTALEAGTCTKVRRELNFSADIEIRAVEVLSEIVPELRLREEYIAGLSSGSPVNLSGLHIDVVNRVLLSPDISKAAETESLDSEDVLHSPNEGELHRDIALLAGDVLVENFEVEGVVEIRAVDKEIETAQERVVDIVSSVCTAIVLDLETEEASSGVLPEIEAAGNLPICT